jgi:hypothetical protein
VNPTPFGANQMLDESIIGIGASLGLATQAGLTGNQYSLVGCKSLAPTRRSCTYMLSVLTIHWEYFSASNYWSQLAWQLFAAALVVKVPNR